MDNEVILKVENVSKQYRLGTLGTGTISHDLNRWWHQMRGKEDPYLKIGEINDRSSKGTSEYVWALKDVNFEVRRGEILGVIGKNGAGKSTLLKILSKVTGPSTGSIKSRGRIASLLEVGTGFHPEMTGRENVYLNGAILGMTKKEISAKIDEIIEFSGCERYIDTPTKRYSSGMTVRLAFAVAAFLEPDILVVDEVLAVGDAEFQKKAIGKMQDISNTDGRTVLFVSHNMAAVQNLCSRCIVLENGSVTFTAGTEESVDYYLKLNKLNSKINLSKRKDRKGSGDIKFIDTWIEDIKGDRKNVYISGKDLFIVTVIKIMKPFNNKQLNISAALSTSKEFNIADLKSSVKGTEIYIDDKNETFKLKCIIPKCNLNFGNYNYNLFLESDGVILDWIINAGNFDIEAGDFYGSGKIPDKGRLLLMDYDWIQETK